MTGPDKYGARLWDIQLIRQIAGLGQNSEIILDQYRVVFIQCKAFPQIKYKREFGFRRLISELVLRSGIYIEYRGCHDTQLFNHLPYHNPSNRLFRCSRKRQRPCFHFHRSNAVIFLGFARSDSSNRGAHTVWRQNYPIGSLARWFRRRYANSRTGQTHLRQRREKLTYEPSSTPFCERELYERSGRELAWVTESNNLS